MGIASEAELAVALQRLARLNEGAPGSPEALERDQLQVDVEQYRSQHRDELDRARPTSSDTNGA